MVEIATILAVIGYATTSFEFFDQINTLTNKQFRDANSLLQDIHLLVTYQPDKTLVGRIDAKFDRFKDYQSRWGTLDDQTLKSFAKEILEGDGSIDNAIRQFHGSVYASGGYFETKTNKIFDDHEGTFWHWESFPSRKIRQDLLKFFPTLVEMEMKATTLIFFGYYLERKFSGDPYRYSTEIDLAKSNHDQRMSQLKSKIDELLAKVDEMNMKEMEPKNPLQTGQIHHG